MTPTIYEHIGRKKLTEILLTNYNASDIKGTEDQFERIDVTALIDGNPTFFEIKCRNNIYDDMILVKDKYKGMLEYGKNNNYSNGYYVVFYKDYCYMWSIRLIYNLYKSGKTDTRYLPETTCGYGDSSNYVLKDIILLPTKEAIKFEKTNNKWIKL